MKSGYEYADVVAASDFEAVVVRDAKRLYGRRFSLFEKESADPDVFGDGMIKFRFRSKIDDLEVP